MNKEIDFTRLGGLFFYQNTLNFLQGAYSQAIDTIGALVGDKVIISGLVEAGGNLSSGWVTYNNVLMPVVGGIKQNYLYLETLQTKEQFNDGQQKFVYTTKRLVLTGLSAPPSIPLTEFKRLPFNSSSLKDAYTKIQTLVKGIVNTESAVIVSGCTVSNVTGSFGGVCDISAGVVLFDGEYVNAPARIAGTWPCYLKSDATYVTAVPTGSYITFDYETSQRYKDVQKRNMYGSMEISISRNPADLAMFDLATGLGKWKWKGWRLSDECASRVIVGYDRTATDPSNGIWDIGYHTLGNTDGGLTNRRPIFRSNLPHEKLDIPVGFNDSSGGTQANMLQKPGETSGSPTSGTIQTAYMGDGIPFDIRQAYRVLLYIERL